MRNSRKRQCMRLLSVSQEYRGAGKLGVVSEFRGGKEKGLEGIVREGREKQQRGEYSKGKKEEQLDESREAEEAVENEAEEEKAKAARKRSRGHVTGLDEGIKINNSSRHDFTSFLFVQSNGLFGLLLAQLTLINRN